MNNITISTTIDMPCAYPSGYLKNIKDRILYIFEYYAQKHSKVMVVRFDIRYPTSYSEEGDNSDISACIAYVVKKYKRQGLDPFYIWVREQHRSIHPHYHCALFLDGQKVRSYGHVFRNVEAAWGRTLGCPVTGCIDHCTAAGSPDYNGKCCAGMLGMRSTGTVTMTSCASFPTSLKATPRNLEVTVNVILGVVRFLVDKDTAYSV